MAEWLNAYDVVARRRPVADRIGWSLTRSAWVRIPLYANVLNPMGEWLRVIGAVGVMNRMLRWC